MSVPFLTSVDLNKNELLNARIQNLAVAPSIPVEGQLYWDTVDEALKIWDGAVWVTWLRGTVRGAANGVASLNGSVKVIEDPANASATAGPGKIPLADSNGKLDTGFLKTGSGNGLDSDLLDGQEGAYYLARVNHTGQQPYSTISDFAAGVAAQRLDQLSAPTSNVSWNNQKIINLADPTGAADAVTKQYVDNLVQGVDAHPSVRAATTVNIVLSGVQTIDGVTLVDGDRVLVKNQTTPAENGLYVVVNGGPWIRATDANSWAELVSAFVFVEEGTTLADTSWLSNVDAGGTLGTNAVTWVQFGSASDVTGGNAAAGSGAGVFQTKIGNVITLRKIRAGSTKITVTENTDDISIDVAEGNLNLANLTGTVPVAKGGTGATDAATARTNLSVPGKYAVSIGDGAATSFAITHGLATTDVIVQVKETGGGLAVVYPEIVITNTTTVTLTFAVAPTTNQYRVIVMG